MGEKLFDLGRVQVAGVAFAVEEDEAGGPLDVALLRFGRVVSQPQHLPQLIEEARRLRLGQFADRDVQDVLVQQPQRQPRRG